MVVEVRGSGWLRDKNLSLLRHPMTPVCRHHRGWGALAPKSSPVGLSAVIKEQKTLRRPPGLGLTFLLGSDLKAVYLLLAPRPQPLRPQKWPCGVWMGELCWEAAAPLEGSCLQKRGHN